jgi:hypothetical protein
MLEFPNHPLVRKVLQVALHLLPHLNRAQGTPC